MKKEYLVIALICLIVIVVVFKVPQIKSAIGL